MPGETDLRALLAGMTPTLRPETYVFRTLPPGETLPAGIVPFATVREDRSGARHAGRPTDLACDAATTPLDARAVANAVSALLARAMP